MPEVTIILPVYNGEKHIKRAIESVLEQTYSDIELIIVNDGSTDRTRTICEEYLAIDKRVLLLNKVNEGVVVARNSGLQCAKGKYITFIDADDWVEKDFIEILWKNMVSSKADIVISGCIKEREGKSEYCLNNIKQGTYVDEEAKKYFYSKMLHFDGFFMFGIQPYLWNKLFNREMLKDICRQLDSGIYDGEDVAIVFPYLLNCNKISVINDCLYHYVFHAESVTANKKEDFYTNVSKLYLNLQRYFEVSQYYNLLLPQLNQFMRYMVWMKKPECYAKPVQYLFPFGEVDRFKKVVIYGAGTVGKEFVRQIKRTSYCQLVGWLDQNYSTTEFRKMGIAAPESVLKLDYDYIVIAIDNYQISKNVEEKLQDIGVPYNKIVCTNKEVRL